MVLASLSDVHKWYGEQTVLAGVQLELTAGSRTALIGRNGSGKSTLLRLLAKREAPDGGVVSVRADVQVGMLEQTPSFPAGASVDAVADAAFTELDAAQAELERLERAGLDDPARYERWERLHEAFERRGGYARRARRDAVLHALGFAGRGGQAVAELSGGETTRLNLARLLMAQPDVALLDEPTNHLDLVMRAWLEGFLARYPGAVVVVSHDRAFLDAACERTVEVRRGALRQADVPPSRYRLAERERERLEARTREAQAKEHGRLAAAALQMKRWAGQNAKLHRRAKAMEGRVERFEATMLDGPPPNERTTRFQFTAPPSGDVVLDARSVRAAFGERVLFDGVDLSVRRGERIVLVGPNGAGKTTLLRILTGERASDDPAGVVRWGARVRVGYFDQSLSRFDPDATLVETLLRLVGERAAHDLLGRFLFPFEAQFKRVADLSGGERARLALLDLTLQETNVLVLDEPTNHLDLEMIEALEAALEAFEGTLLVVSHDRRLLERLAERVWEVEDGHFEDYQGEWAYYLRQRRERREAEDALTAAAAPAGHEADHAGDSSAAARPDDDPRSSWQLRREAERLEAEVERCSRALAAAEAELERLNAAAQDGAALAAAGEAYQAAEAALLAAMAAWSDVDGLLRDRSEAAAG